MTPSLFTVLKRAPANVMKRLDGLGLPIVANCLGSRRAYSDGTGKYLRKKAATTPIGLPIPGSAYTQAIAKTLLRRALPLPAQLLLQLLEMLNQPPDGVNIPPGWNVGCDNPTPSGGGTVTNQTWGAGRVGGACPPPVCLNNQALTPRGPLSGDCRMLLLAPGSIAGRFDVMRTIGADPAGGACAATCGGLPKPAYRQRWMFRDVPLNPPPGPGYKPWTKTKPDTKPNRITPKIDPQWVDPPVYPPAPGRVEPPKTDPQYDHEWRWVPPEWADPNLAPELVPPTAPRLDPPHRPFWAIPGTNTVPVFESPPGHGTERGPTPRPPAPRVEPPAPVPVAVSLPGGGTVQIPPPITRPVTLGGPGVSVTINPPGQPALVSRPPGPRNKERKLIVAVPAGAAKRLIGGITEGLDMIDCLHDALPKHLQAKKLRKPPHSKGGGRFAKPSVKRKAAAVYKAFAKQADALEGQIEHGVQNYVLSANDIMNAIVTCGQQQFMDRIYAEIGRAGGRAGRKLGMSTGVGMGGSARSSVTFGM